jgi:predicted transcriptional regulator
MLVSSFGGEEVGRIIRRRRATSPEAARTALSRMTWLVKIYNFTLSQSTKFERWPPADRPLER